MEKSYICSKVKKYLSDQFFCTIDELEQNNIVYTISKTAKKPYIKILAYSNCVIICTSEDIYLLVKSALSEKNRDEIFEFPFVYGQTIHYVPDVDRIKEPYLTDMYSYELIQGNDINKLAGAMEFHNSLSFNSEGKTLTKIVFLARKGDEIVGMAGAGAETDKLWEVGVDIKSEFRNGGLGTNLVRMLTIEVLKKGIIPFYSASVTNIGSQMVASRSGYIPFWIDTYGTILDGSSVYGSYVKNLKL